jgi:TldD protein|tara:strand:+ start:5780 stop:7129 length:1350 start_codon:yes stop_codon:yes gene_type:complete
MMDIDKVQKIFDLPARYIDITLQTSETNSILLKDGIAKDIASGKIEGISVRVLNRIWNFVSTNNIDNIFSLAEKACRGSNNGQEIKFSPGMPVEDNVKIKPKKDPLGTSLEEKIELMHEAEDELKGYKEVISSSISYADSKSINVYLNSEGSEIHSEYPRTIFSTYVFAKKNGKIQGASERLGGVGGLEHLKEHTEVSNEAAAKAIRLLHAGEAPKGNHSIILDPRLNGVFMHEAVGHAVEADHVIQGESILESKLKKKIASSDVTLFDDPTLKNSFGFYHYDSEGTKAMKKAVIKDGLLNTYLHSRESASTMKQIKTGNARSQSFDHPPIVRMSNTYIEPKDYRFNEMLEEIDFGVYLKGSKGGEVDPARGVFQFNAEEGFLIEKGKLTTPIRDVSLSGRTLEVLHQINAVGRDFGLHIGFCGKGSQMVPVGDGGPHVRTFATVGGTQ